MPCQDLFNEQPASYRDDVLKPGTVRIAVEAGIEMGWQRYVGESGGFIGMDSFGASAPYKQLYEHFGITADAVTKAVKERL